MISRRSFTIGTIAGGLSSSLVFSQQKPTQNALVIDAMGEIRDVYTEDLILEMIDSGLNAITVTLCDPKTFESEAYQAAINGLWDYDRLIKRQNKFYVKALSVKDIHKANQEKKIAIFFLFQNSTQFGRNLDNVDIFYNLGVRSSQITYNWQNWAGSGCNEENGSGLTRFGYQLVEKMNEIGMLIDLSHAGMRTMKDTIAASKEPVVISHTCCKALYDHNRNTTDQNIRAVAEKGGLVGITQMRPFMTREQKNAVHFYYEHIEHAVNVAGTDHVCIGSDRDHRRLVMTDEYLQELKREEGENFDPTMWPLYFEELNGPRRMETIWDGLKKRGMSEDQLEKLMGLNLLRLYQKIYG
jgi:membrane dipeptidase